MRLTLVELAREAETTPVRLERLIDAAIIRPGDDGLFGPGDIHRSKIVGGFESAGITIEQLERAIRDHLANFDSVELFYPAPSRRSDRSFSAFKASLGDRGRLLESAHAALGLPDPDPDGHLTERDETTLAAFLEAWDLGGDEVVTRAARLMSDAVRRAAEGWVDLFYEQVSDPVQRRVLDQGLPVEAMIPHIVPAAARVAALAPEMLDWLLERHLEQVLNARNIDAAEEQFVRRGLAPPRPPRPPAIVFADVAGYTSFTQERGDQEAARIAVRLGELSDAAARRHGGRLVKVLGDGALLRFDSPAQGILAALDIVAEAMPAQRPPVHVGIHAGPLIIRDGDVCGHTVNIASRVAGVAGAGEVVVTEDVVAEIAPEEPISFEPLGPAELKGVAEAIALQRASRRQAR